MELVNVPLQAGLWFGSVDLPVTVPNLVGYSVFALLLVEGPAIGRQSSTSSAVTLAACWVSARSA